MSLMHLINIMNIWAGEFLSQFLCVEDQGKPPPPPAAMESGRGFAPRVFRGGPNVHLEQSASFDAFMRGEMDSCNN
jgi:hypothetical protein